MQHILLIGLLASSFAVTAQNKDYSGLYNKYKHIFTPKSVSKGISTVVSVGDDPMTCDFSTIQAAINSGADEVHIQRLLTFNENLTVQNKSIKLMGGYFDCSLVQSTSKSTIDGNNLAPVINIDNDNSVYAITMDQLWLQNGNSGINFLGGGVEAKGMLTSIEMNDVRVNDNTGSGINVEGIEQLIIKNALIFNNNAIVGGGIACSDTFVTVYGATAIYNNSASSFGGGIYAYNQCSFSYFSGQPHPSSGFGGIRGNTTAGDGAGIYAYEGSTINLNGIEIDFGNGNILGDSSRPVILSANNSDTNGGGIFLSGANTQAFLTGVQLEFNKALTGYGGAIAVADQAQMTITRYDIPCWDDIKCNTVYFNDSATNGGGIYAEANSTIGVANAYFENNTSNFGTAIWITGGTTATVEGSTFTDNNARLAVAGNYVIGADVTSVLTLGFNTFVDNLAATSTIAVFGSTMTNVGNLFYEYETSPIISQLISTVTNYCVVSRDITGLVGSNITQAVFDPFVDRDNQDFHLHEISGFVAVDRCNDSVYSPALKDMDHETRGVDLPIPNIDGPYDVGADEFFVQEIFSDGFE